MGKNYWLFGFGLVWFGCKNKEEFEFFLDRSVIKDEK